MTNKETRMEIWAHYKDGWIKVDSFTKEDLAYSTIEDRVKAQESRIKEGVDLIRLEKVEVETKTTLLKEIMI